jgi:hypothetical protein
MLQRYSNSTSVQGTGVVQECWNTTVVHENMGTGIIQGTSVNQ